MKHKALLIDPETQSITEIEVGQNNLKDMYDQMKCDCIATATYFHNGDALWCDDEGVLKKEQKGAIIMQGWDYPIVGRSMVTGMKVPDTTDPKTTIEELKIAVIWIDEETTKRYCAKFN